MSKPTTPGSRPCPTPGQLKSRFEAMGTIRDVARSYGVSPDTCRKWFREAGLEIPGRLARFSARAMRKAKARP